MPQTWCSMSYGLLMRRNSENLIHAIEEQPSRCVVRVVTVVKLEPGISVADHLFRDAVPDVQ